MNKNKHTHDSLSKKAQGRVARRRLTIAKRGSGQMKDLPPGQRAKTVLALRKQR